MELKRRKVSNTTYKAIKIMTEASEGGDTRQVCTRNVPVVGDTSRNTQPRTDANHRVQGNDGTGIYRSHVDLSMENIQVHQSNAPGAMQRRPFNPNSTIISLQDYIQGGTQLSHMQ